MILIKLQNIKAKAYQDLNGLELYVDGVSAERASQGLPIRLKIPKLGKGKKSMIRKEYYKIIRTFKDKKLLTLFN